MKRYINIIFVMLVLLLANGSLNAQEDFSRFEGKWIDESKGGHIQIKVEGNEISASLLFSKYWKGNENLLDANNKNKELRGRKVKGINIFRNLKYNSKKGAWLDGEIYDFRRGEWFSCILKEKNGTLFLTGFIGLSWIGKTVEWERL